MATTTERDEIRLLALEIKDEYFHGSGANGRYTLESVAETVLRRRLVPAAAYSLPLGELKVGRREGS
jgi:hypothetical protein